MIGKIGRLETGMIWWFVDRNYLAKLAARKISAVPSEGASQLRDTLLSILYVGSMSAMFLLETLDHPFMREVMAHDGGGCELGRLETLVYTRSHLRIPLHHMPEEGGVGLPRGPGRAPLLTSVE